MFLAQVAADAPLALDWKHYALMAGMALVGVAVQWFNAGGKQVLLDRLNAAGHPQAAITIELLSEHFAANATTAEKQALARAASDAGVDHPAITQATK